MLPTFGQRRFVERRQEPRHSIEHLAKIQPRDDSPPGYCLVTEISEGGVRLNTYGLDIPDEFKLFFVGKQNAQDGSYRVIWRRDREVGAKLISR